MAKELQVFRSLGTSFSIGWPRDDLPHMVHVFAQAKPGENFYPHQHWPCDVCKDHGFTEADFHAQIQGALEKGPVGE